MKTSFSRIFLMAMPLFAHVVCVHAQVDRGTIVGAVTDPSGAVIPGTQIKVIKIDTNATTDLETNSAGLYTAPNLPLGTYRLIFEKAGFGKLVRQPVEIRAGGEVRVDATLSVGNVSESVSVSTEAPLIDVGTVSNTAGFSRTPF